MGSLLFLILGLQSNNERGKPETKNSLDSFADHYHHNQFMFSRFLRQTASHLATYTFGFCWVPHDTTAHVLGSTCYLPCIGSHNSRSLIK